MKHHGPVVLSSGFLQKLDASSILKSGKYLESV